MSIACIGGGPAGLYFAISMKLRDPRCEVHLLERNPRGVTFDWGVVFSDQTAENLMGNDPVSGALLGKLRICRVPLPGSISAESSASGGNAHAAALTRPEMDVIRDQFVAATRMTIESGAT